MIKCALHKQNGKLLFIVDWLVHLIIVRGGLACLKETSKSVISE